MMDARQVILLAGSALLLAACGNSGGLTTASLIGGGPAAPVPAAATPPPSDPSSRAVQVGATSARAVHCRFHFDPDKLKSSFLAAEAAQGLSPDQLHKIEREYEFIRLSLAKKLSGSDEYCTDAKAREIKADLARHLAGDYTPTPKKSEPESEGIFAGLTSSGQQAPWKAKEHFDELAPGYKRPTY